MKLSRFFTKELTVLYLIIGVGIFLRFTGVFTNSFAFTYDVGRDMLALWNIAYNHKIPLIGATTGLPGVFYGPWWYYMLTPFFVIFRGNPQGIAFLMASLGIASTILAFFMGKKIGKAFLGLIFAAIVSVSPVLISLSSQIWNPNIAPFFVLLLLYAMYKIYSKTALKYYFLIGLLLALNLDLEIVFGLFLIIGIIASLIFTLKRDFKIKNILSLLVGFLLIASPRIIFELRHQFLMTKAFISFLTSGNSSHSLIDIFNIFTNRAQILFDQFSSTVALENRGLALIAILIIVFAVIKYYKKLDPIIKKFIIVSITVICTFLIGTTFFSHDIWPHYLVGLPIFYILLLSIALYLLQKNLSNKSIVPVIIIVIFILNLNPVSVARSFTKTWVGDASVYRNQLNVIDYVYKEAYDKDFKYVVYTPPLNDYTYQYLFLWYGSKKYHISPKNQANLAFFILEPDLQYPSRLRDWLVSRSGDGKIIKSQKFSSGIIVQTRIH